MAVTTTTGKTASRFSNLSKALNDPRTRLVFFGGLGLALMVMMFAVARLSSDGPVGDAEVQVAHVAVPNGAQPSTQPVNTQVYEELTSQAEQASVAQAKQSEGTAMPIPRVGEAPPASNPADDQATLPRDGGSTVGTAQPAQDDQQQRILQMEEQLRQQRYAAMARQFDLLVGRWGSSAGEFQSQRVQTPAEVPPTEVSSPATRVSPQEPAVASGIASQPLIQANTLSLGVTLSESNTDDALPLVRARVLSGPAKGALISGQIQVGPRAEGGLVRFTQLTPANGGAAVAIDAVAVDPRTARASVASDVDKHTVSRMGALFLSSVLGGVSEAMLRGGQQETVIANGQTTLVQREAYSDRDLALIGVGRVGSNAAGLVESAVNRPPTVRLRAGTEIGVLFLQDVNL